MKICSILASALLAISSAATLFADTTDEQPDPKQQLWEAKLSPTSMVTIAVSQIVSVSLHPYLLNGDTLITEVTVDTQGNNTLRFYYIHPDDEQDISDPEAIVRNARKRIRKEVSTQPNDKASIPSLKFPEGAYAHTIEYQMSSLDSLLDLHKSLITVWEKSSKKRTTYTASDN